MRPLRLLLGAAAAGAVLAAVAVGLVYWLLTTEAGARRVVERLVDATGAVLTAETVSGTLVDGLRFTGLDFRIERVEATAGEATATFDLAALLGGRVVIRDLFVSRVTVVPLAAPPAADAEEPFAAVDLPVELMFESIVVAGVDLLAGGDTYPFGQLTMTVSYIDRVVDIVRFESTYGGFTFSTQAAFDLSSEPAVDATVSLSGRAAETDVLLGARATGVLPVLSVDADLLEPTPVEIAGTVTVNAEPDFDLALSWRAIDAQLLAASGLADIGIAAGSGRVSGQPDAVDFDATTVVTIDGAPLSVTANGRYTPTLITLDAARLERESAAVDVTGTLDPATLEFAGSVGGTGVDPAWLIAGWDGAVDLSATLAGAFGAGWRVAASGVTVDGVVRERPFTATGEGTYAESGVLDVRDAELRVGASTLRASGQAGTALSLDVVADVADIGAFVEGIEGRLSGTIAVSGRIDDPRLRGEISLVGLEIANVSIAAVEASGELGLSGDSPVAVDVTASGARIGSVPAVDLVGRVTGAAANHTASFTVTGADWQGGGSLEGSLDGPSEWRGLIAALTYAQPPIGAWTLRQPAALSLTAAQIDLDTACLAQGGSELCLGLVYGDGGDGRLRVSATDFDLAVLQPLLPEGVTVAGVYQAEIDVSGPRANPVGTLRIAGGRTELSYARTATDSVTAVLERVSADARIDLDDFQSSAELIGAGADNVRFRLAGARRQDEAIALDGQIDASWADIAPLTILSRHVGAVTGSATAAVRIGGTLAAPQFDGEAELDSGRLELPDWGVVAESIRGTATSGNGESVEFQATGMVDGSELTLTGSTLLTAASGWPTRLELAGERVPLVQIADADIVVSPALRIDVDLPRVDVVGTVDVPEALISIASLPEQAVRPSADAVVYGVEEADRVSPVQLAADIELRLGDDVHYRGSGLIVDLGGAIRLRYSSQTSTDASGTLSMKGTYEAFGQELVLERGELVFTGPLANPNLNVRATRRIEEISVGIDLTGSLEAPVARIFSEPLMAEADAVSYLLFGRPLAVPEGTGDPDQLRNAAVSLGLRQAVPVIQRIGDSLGFDEFAIESTEVDVGELMAGKYLSPKLYVRYSYGLFNRIGGLLLQYQLNERLSIETRSGNQKSMDILFTIERD